MARHGPGEAPDAAELYALARIRTALPDSGLVAAALAPTPGELRRRILDLLVTGDASLVRDLDLGARLRRGMALGPVVALARCPGCREPWCLIHERHDYDCACPGYLDLVDDGDGR